MGGVGYHASPEASEKGGESTAVTSLREVDVSFFEYLEKIELYCSKENYNLGIFRELENFVLLF